MKVIPSSHLAEKFPTTILASETLLSPLKGCLVFTIFLYGYMLYVCYWGLLVSLWISKEEEKKPSRLFRQIESLIRSALDEAAKEQSTRECFMSFGEY